MEKVRIVRSVTHGDTTHTSAGYTMLTGWKLMIARIDRFVRIWQRRCTSW
jgi:hypothetical protein